MANHFAQRRNLDSLLLFDAAASLLLGAVALLTPHGLLQKFVGGGERVFDNVNIIDQW